MKFSPDTNNLQQVQSGFLAGLLSGFRIVLLSATATATSATRSGLLFLGSSSLLSILFRYDGSLCFCLCFSLLLLFLLSFLLCGFLLCLAASFGSAFLVGTALLFATLLLLPLLFLSFLLFPFLLLLLLLLAVASALVLCTRAETFEP